MDVRVKFLGAAGTVTGSKFLLEIGGFNLLVDCGMFQGMKNLRLLNWDDFPVEVSEIDAVVLTHAHLDHSGYLPRLFKQGYQGAVHCTRGTADLLGILLRDSAKLQEEEAEYAKRKGYSKHSNPLPLYDTKDVELVFPNIVPHAYGEEVILSDTLKLRFYNAGHILGAAIVEIIVRGDEQTKTIVFSGDLGRSNDPVLFPPQKLPKADILFVESTYGNREQLAHDIAAELGEAILDGLDRGGCILIPAFAVGRSQSVLYYLNELMREKVIPRIPIYMDSPMAIAATRMYLENDEDHKVKREDLMTDGGFLTLQNQLRIVRDHADSVALNDLKGGAIILSASGMMTGGRILHHLYHRLPRPQDTLLIVGFQPEGTRGRRILEGEEKIRIFGEEVAVNCSVVMIDGLSAHADCKEILEWLNGFEDSPKMTFVIHGEREASEALRIRIEHDLNWNVVIPEYLESVLLFEHI